MRSPLTRALALLLAVTALLPAALLARAPACRTREASIARSCCCEPVAPACGAAASLQPRSCGCCAAPDPAAPAERTLTPSPELTLVAAPPPAIARAVEAPPAAEHRCAPSGHRAAGCELLRLHCVILI